MCLATFLDLIVLTGKTPGLARSSEFKSQRGQNDTVAKYIQFNQLTDIYIWF